MLQHSNYKQFPSIVELAFSIGVENIYVNGLEPYTEDISCNTLWYSKEKHADIYNILKRSFDIAKDKVNIQLSSFIPMQPSCDIINIPTVLPNGDVVPCSPLCYDRDRFFIVDKKLEILRQKGKTTKKCFGNIFQEKLIDVWNKKEYVSFRENVKRNKFPEECDFCLIKHKMICPPMDISSSLIISQLLK